MTRSHWMTLLLVISLGINVFAVGVLVGPHVRHRMGPRPFDLDAHRGPPLGPGSREPLPALRGVVKVMGGRKDARVRAMWDQRHGTMQVRKRQLALAQAQLEQSLVSSPYSEPAVLAALDLVRSEAQGVAQLSGQSLLELMRQLTPEERVELKRWVEKPKDTPPKLR